MSLVSRIDESALDAEGQAAFAAEAARAGRVTNMKATLLHALPAFRVFGGWGGVKDAVRQAVGERALSVFSHAISDAGGCLLCTTYFRRLLIQEGTRPEDFQPTEVEQALIDLGAVISTPGGRPDAALQARLKALFDDATIVNLTAYGATMAATNIFNNVIGVELDEYLQPFVRG